MLFITPWKLQKEFDVYVPEAGTIVITTDRVTYEIDVQQLVNAKGEVVSELYARQI